MVSVVRSHSQLSSTGGSEEQDEEFRRFVVNTRWACRVKTTCRPVRSSIDQTVSMPYVKGVTTLTDQTVLKTFSFRVKDATSG